MSLGRFFGLPFFASSLTARGDNCDFCGKPIYGGTIFLVTDKVTGEKKEACADCVKAAHVFHLRSAGQGRRRSIAGRSLALRP